MLDHLLFGHPLAWLRDHNCLDCFTPLLIRHAYDRGLLDLWVSVEDLFYLGGVYILTATYDHILNPAHNVHVAFLVQPYQIAGVIPALFVKGRARFRGLVPVFAHHLGAPLHELTSASGRHLVTLFIYDHGLNTIEGLTDRADLANGAFIFKKGSR